VLAAVDSTELVLRDDELGGLLFSWL